MQVLLCKVEGEAEACLVSRYQQAPSTFAKGTRAQPSFLSSLCLFLPSLSSFLSLPLPLLSFIFLFAPCHLLLSIILPSTLVFFSSFSLSCSPLLSLSVLAWGPGLLPLGPSGSLPLSSTISHMSIRKRQHSPHLPPFPGPAAMLKSSTICCIHPGHGEHFATLGRQSLVGTRR